MGLRVSAPWFLMAVALAGCGTRPLARNEGHIAPDPRPAAVASIPEPIRAIPLPPPPEAR